jgi:hypothetical protein
MVLRRVVPDGPSRHLHVVGLLGVLLDLRHDLLFAVPFAFHPEVAAAGVSHDLAYIIGIEHTTASVGGASPPATRCR